MAFLTKVLEFRGAARMFYQKYQIIIETLFRFLLSYLAFHTINETLAYNMRLTHPVIELGLGAVGAFLPPVILILLCAMVALFQVYSASPILAALVLLIFAVLYCFIARFSGRFGYAVVAVPILYGFHMPYMVPLLLGLVGTPMTIFPAACGVVVYYLFRVVADAATRRNIASLDETLALYIDVVDSLMGHREMFLTVSIFAIVILIMYLVRKLRFEFSFEVTIVMGGLVNVVAFLLAELQLDMNVSSGEVILGTLGSMAIVFLVQFFRMILDYMAVETVQFEDDDYYYYVKAVPKVDVAMPQKNVTTFSDEEAEEEPATTKGKEDEFKFEE